MKEGLLLEKRINMGVETNPTQLLIFTDGGSRGNPGPAAIGVSVVNQDGLVIYELNKTIGYATNNIAEYQAFLASAVWLRKHLSQTSPLPHLIIWQIDSLLVVEQLNKRWKIKDKNLSLIAQQIWQQLGSVGIPYQIKYIPRELNKRADWLVNQALDHQ